MITEFRELSRIRPARQTFSKVVGLAVFGADALSSIACAPQETLVILAEALQYHPKIMMG